MKMKKFFISTLLAIAVLSVALISCKKENLLHTNNSLMKSEKGELEIQNHDTICQEDELLCFSSSSSSGNIGVSHSVPNVISQLAQNPDYGDYYYFDSLFHDCSLDTAGCYYYAAPSKYWPNEYLTIAVEGDSLLMYYIFDFPKTLHLHATFI